jgi:uncharacterized cupin superfamily protein
VHEAKLEQTDSGLVPEGDGWFVVNARDARWWRTGDLGSSVSFEGEVRFSDYGINIHVLQPGEPNCMYHGEAGQEDFLVLSGECILLVEGEERPLRAWDFVHCPAWTEHVFVGAGSEPCAILMVGTRTRGDDPTVIYPVEDVALRHGAGVEVATTEARQAYARFGPVEAGPYPGGLPER